MGGGPRWDWSGWWRPLNVLRALTKPLPSFTRNSDETQQWLGNLKEIVPLLGQGLSLVSRAGPADTHPGKYRELLKVVEQPQRWQFLNCPAFGTIPYFSLFFGFHSLANRLLTLTDFMGCYQSYSSPRLLQGELSVTPCAKLDPYGPGGWKSWQCLLPLHSGGRDKM